MKSRKLLHMYLHYFIVSKIEIEILKLSLSVVASTTLVISPLTFPGPINSKHLKFESEVRTLSTILTKLVENNMRH